MLHFHSIDYEPIIDNPKVISQQKQQAIKLIIINVIIGEFSVLTLFLLCKVIIYNIFI